MQKDELIQLHAFLYQMKAQILTNLEDDCDDPISVYYERLDVTPYQIHKSKREHKLAVFALSKEIADLMRHADSEFSLEKISGRLEQMAIRSMTEKEKELYHTRDKNEEEEEGAVLSF